MRTVRKILLAGIAAVALAGSAGLALAKGPALHTMTLQMPGGGTAQIQYSGNVPPKVTFDPQPFMADFYSPESPFATLDRISAEMNREMSALAREADTMTMPLWNPDGIFDAGLGNAPPGVTQYSMITTMSGDGHVCTRSMEMTSTGKGKRPKVVSHTSGDCHAIGRATLDANPFASPEDGQRSTVQVKSWRSDQATTHQVQDAVFRSVR